jgi:hypothetical protein
VRQSYGFLSFLVQLGSINIAPFKRLQVYCYERVSIAFAYTNENSDKPGRGQEDGLAKPKQPYAGVRPTHRKKYGIR